MEISALSAVNSVNTKHSMPLSGKGPDWSIIPSSGKSSKSKAEFTDEIKELARKAANTTSKAELEYIHRRRTELCAEYMSDVSPDRKALYRQAENALKEQGVHLKVVVDRLTRSFYYSYDGEVWTLAGVLENCVYLCDEGVPDDPKRHTGTLVGIYANNGGCGTRIPADFDYFEYID